MRDKLHLLCEDLLSVIYPRRCIACGRSIDRGYLCDECLRKIHFLNGEVDAPIHKHYTRLFALAAYEGPVLQLVHKLKYGRGRVAVGVIKEFVKGTLRPFGDVDCVIPVPEDVRRYMWRGYNQSVIIAGIVSNLLGKPCLKRALAKSRRTEPQVGKSLVERRDNLRGSFSVTRSGTRSLRGGFILLVDDVVTSGATIDECARVLRRAGAARIDVLTLAKTL